MKPPPFLLAFAAVLSFPFAASGANFTLSSLDDDGSGSLRKILQSAGSVGVDLIRCDPSINGGVLTLTTGELAEAVAAGRTIELDASNLRNGLTITADDNSRLFRFTGSGRVILRNITLTAGKPGSGDPSAPDGGAIHTSVDLELYDCIITQNSCATSSAGADGGRGGAIFSTADITLENTVFSGNQAASGGDGTGAAGGNGGDGGAIYTTGSILAIDTDFRLNRAGDGGSADAANNGGDGGSGGAVVASGMVTLEGCEFSSNRAGSGGSPADMGSGGNGGLGGAIRLESGADLSVIQTSFALNKAGDGGDGGINSGDGGDAGDGGAIFQTGTAGTIERSAFVNNETGDGGAMGPAGTNGLGADGGAIFVAALSSDDTLDIVNTLVASNGASDNGGGIYQSSTSGPSITIVSLVHVTVTENVSVGPGGGLDGDSGRLDFESTIVARNFVGFPPGIPLDPNNTHSNTGNSGATISPVNQNHISDNPGLGSAGIFGGDIIAMLPQAGSPVLNAAGVSLNTPATDQRGFTRNFGAAPDIGAAEISFQADNRIGLKSNSSTHRLDDFYTSTGKRQEITVRTKGRKKGNSYLSMENDGDRDVLQLRSTNPGGKLNFRVFRVTGGRKNLTSAVKSRGYSSDPQDRGRIVKIETQVGSKSKKRSIRKKIAYTVNSAATPSAIDVSILKVVTKKQK
ncbi:MAG: choice-of-anchor Q domain-containing protein [Verrucomicrobiales bacterium]|nr:choice-of-anchor Q domain-containing protein [Verrucomicrobiales bacterium]